MRKQLTVLPSQGFITDAVIDRAEGLLLGLAAGDRNGGPIQMATRLAESLIEKGNVDIPDIGSRYMDWWRNGAFDTGPTAASAFALVDSGESFANAAEQIHRQSNGLTAGRNPAHRSAPLAMLCGANNAQLEQAARREAALTHLHPLSGDVAVAVVMLCRELIQGPNWEKALRIAKIGRLSETQVAMASSKSSTGLSTGGFAPDVLAAAIYFVGRSDNFDDALAASLAFAGPENYCPVLVGSIGGARWGARSISELMLQHCAILPRVRSVASSLAALLDSRLTFRTSPSTVSIPRQSRGLYLCEPLKAAYMRVANATPLL